MEEIRGSQVWKPVFAGVLYSLTFFLIMIEGQTTLLEILFAVLFFRFAFVTWKNRFYQQPALDFFLVAYLVATLLFASGWIVWGDFRESSEAGWI